MRLANLVPSLSKYDFCLTPTQRPNARGRRARLERQRLSGRSALSQRARAVLGHVGQLSRRRDRAWRRRAAPRRSRPRRASTSIPRRSTTVVLFGTDNGAQLQLKSFREEKGTIAEPKVRFINAWSDGPPSLECGVTTSDELPATIIGAVLFGQNASFGNVAPAVGEGRRARLLHDCSPAATLPFGFAADGTGATTGVSGRAQPERRSAA